MWLFLPFGFYSVVQKERGDTLTIRARFRADLERLRDEVLPELSAIEVGGGTDYPYRATATRERLRAAMARVVDTLDYPNFKAEVGRRTGSGRAYLYEKVWDLLNDAERREPEAAGAARVPAPSTRPAPMPTRAAPGSSRLKPAYGGVVLNGKGEVLLTRPRGEFGGYAWTWPKGRPRLGEAPEAAAARETREETGVEAIIEREVPGVFEGSITVTRFWLMRATGKTGPLGQETEAVRWVPLEGAAALIDQTRNVVGRMRDLEVLAQVKALLARG